MRKILAILASGLVAFLASNNATSAKTEFPAIGGAGDIANGSWCPQGEYLAGFKGRVGDFIDSIQPICAKVLPGGAWGALSYEQIRFGGGGGSPAEFSCPRNSFVSALDVYLTVNNRQVSQVYFQCYTPSNGVYSSTPIRFGGAIKRGRSTNQACPSGEIGKGINVRSGKHVNALGLTCGRFVIPKK
jgi:hypothetical protein